ncbi:ligase-associated DNA damage response endonuclease PdeM [Loktanella sp. F6476L]|uniref:ligase-associated DNA damage response endonuclease PdeM n=1 Tax=Loktanella sp. F6476L TaxID=2926405 RepID=UPI001FF43B96|nr:ligase-associated DNA damage response endonuclease PdeM [Loktanella sp. F6476L]MCK0120156.1 ligase-associated DNA damage response endonuclease PdeM [Loktanella sp. F6476L]
MTAHVFTFADLTFHAEATGALWIPDHRTLVVSDLHLGKSDRIARRTGTLIPPYENLETLNRLEAEINRLDPQQIVCLGDSFDDLLGVDALDEANQTTLLRLQAGRTWVWIEGNHDPGPVDLGGSHLSEMTIGTVAFRHIASDAVPEVSGHYHPKHGVPGMGRLRPCFVYDTQRLILPAFGAYTGGLKVSDAAIRQLFSKQAITVLTGSRAVPVPLGLVRRQQGRGGRFG